MAAFMALLNIHVSCKMLQIVSHVPRLPAAGDATRLDVEEVCLRLRAIVGFAPGYHGICMGYA